jgi:SAM-dependent methyltransferase
MTPIEQAYYLGMLSYIKALYGDDANNLAALQSYFQAMADSKRASNGATNGEVKLNLGSADDLRQGFINVDVVPAPGVVVADLSKPWPWQDSSVDHVRASHVIEHLPDKILTMNELWRVLKPGGKVEIDVPTTDGPGAWQDPTHVSFWNRRSFLYYEAGSPYRDLGVRQYKIKANFRTVEERLTPTPDGPILSITLEAVKP